LKNRNQTGWLEEVFLEKALTAANPIYETLFFVTVATYAD